MGTCGGRPQSCKQTRRALRHTPSHGEVPCGAGVPRGAAPRLVAPPERARLPGWRSAGSDPAAAKPHRTRFNRLRVLPGTAPRNRRPSLAQRGRCDAPSERGREVAPLTVETSGGRESSPWVRGTGAQPNREDCPRAAEPPHSTAGCRFTAAAVAPGIWPFSLSLSTAQGSPPHRASPEGTLRPTDVVGPEPAPPDFARSSHPIPSADPRPSHSAAVKFLSARSEHFT